MILYQIENGGKSIFLCLKEIVQNGSANILDFKINICDECSWKKNKCPKSLCFLEIRVLRLYVMTAIQLLVTFIDYTFLFLKCLFVIAIQPINSKETLHLHHFLCI